MTAETLPIEEQKDNLAEAIRPVGVIIRREVRDQLRDWRIVLPIVVLTAVFPTLLDFTGQQFTTFLQSYQAQVVGDRLIPLLLMLVGFFPITISLVIALESFVGEKERRSIEPLLSSPLEDWQLFSGKLIASLILPMGASYFGTAIFLTGIYTTAKWRPELSLISLALGLTTVQALVMVCGAVVVSSQTTSVRAANLLASFIVVPMALIVQAESIAMFWARYDILKWSMIGMLIIAIMLVRMGLAYFNREELLGRELDSLNFRWAWTIFRSSFVGGARSAGEWYRHETPRVLRRMALPGLLMASMLAAGVLLGASQVNLVPFPRGAFSQQTLRYQFIQGVQSLPLFTVGGVPVIWLHNLRAVFLATLLGMVSFGTLGVIVLMLPLFIIGYAAGAAATTGFSPWIFMAAFVLPHGLLELPAMALAGAAILKIGATLTTYSKEKTIGEAFLIALADWSKIMLALVIPLLLGAAALEVLVTPHLAVFLLSR